MEHEITTIYQLNLYHLNIERKDVLILVDRKPYDSDKIEYSVAHS